MQARDDHIRVYAEPTQGIHHTLGIITVERVGTLRPQLVIPYLTGNVRFLESYADYHDSVHYYDHLQQQIPNMQSDIFEILLQLQFLSEVFTQKRLWVTLEFLT